MKLTIEIELDDYTDLLGMLAKNGKKKFRLNAVAPGPSNGQRPSAGTQSKLQTQVANMRAA